MLVMEVRDLIWLQTRAVLDVLMRENNMERWRTSDITQIEVLGEHG